MCREVSSASEDHMKKYVRSCVFHAVCKQANEIPVCQRPTECVYDPHEEREEAAITSGPSSNTVE